MAEVTKASDLLKSELIKFELVSPARLVKSEPVEMVVVPCSEGDIGVLPGHAPLIATVRPGVISIYAGGKVSDSIFVAGGFCEVTAERCTMLAEEAESLSSINPATAEARMADAEAAVEAADEAGKPAAERALRVAEAYLAASRAA